MLAVRTTLYPATLEGWPKAVASRTSAYQVAGVVAPDAVAYRPSASYRPTGVSGRCGSGLSASVARSDAASKRPFAHCFAEPS